jgi:hypothetical protein
MPLASEGLSVKNEQFFFVFLLFFPFSLVPLVFPFWVFSALLVLADLFSPFGFRRALYVAWVCFAWFYFLLEPFFFNYGPSYE